MLIEEMMIRNVITLTPSHTVKDAIQIMNENNIRHLPIITATKSVIGIITDRDLKEVIPSILSETKDMNIYNTPLSEVMTKNPITGHPMDFVEDSANIFYQQNIGSLPITSNGELVGIITETDLLYNYIELTGAHQPGSQIEVRVPNTPGILFEVSKVFHTHQINVLSLLVYPDKQNEMNKILVFRLNTMNPLNIIESIKSEGFEVLWPSTPRINL